jgi:hypothetical protein
VVIIAPSGYLFYRMTRKSVFESNAHVFVEEVIKKTEDNLMINEKPIFAMDTMILEISVVNSYIDSTTIGIWNRQKENYDLEDVGLKIIQGEDVHAIVDRKLKEDLGLSRDQNQLVNMLKEKELLIANMEGAFSEYKEEHEEKLDLDYILKGFKEEYTEINKITINKSIGFNEKNQLDTNYIIAVQFIDGIASEEQTKLKSRISKRFCFELKEKINLVLERVPVIDL